MSERNRELLNLTVVAMLTALGFASVYIARQAVVSTASLSYAAFFFALYLVAHLVARYAVPHADPYLLPMAALLTAVGVTEIYRLNPDNAFKQGLWIVIAVGVFSATLLLLGRDYRVLESYKYLFGLSAIFLLVLPALPGFGTTVNGARLWVRAGPLQFQPGELAKLALIVFLAGYLREKREVLAQGRLKDLGPLLVIWGGAMLVLVETNDLGSGLLYFGVFLAMLYVATGKFAYVIAGRGALRHRLGRRLQDLRPRAGPRRRSGWTPSSTRARAATRSCRPATRSRTAASAAPGSATAPSRPPGSHTTYIPYLNTDFIFAALAQELGLIGAAGLLLVYMLFVARGFRIALLTDDGFSKLLAVGLTFAFALQAFIIVGGIIGLIPLTGITMPFVSYGGSSVVANFVLLAGLMLVSNRANSVRGGDRR